MNNLHVKLLGEESIANAPVYVEVINTEMETVAEFSIPVNKSQDIQLEAGKYLIQAILPSGKTIKTKALVAENQANEAVLELISSTNQELKWYEFLGNTYTWTINQKITQIPSIWLRLWSYEEMTWKVKRFPSRWNLFQKWPKQWDLPQNEINTNFSLELAENQLRFSQIGGSEIPWFFIALPPKSHFGILVRPLNNESNFCEISVTVSSHNNRESETLLSYLISGNIRAAKVVGDKLIERLLSEKNFEKLEAIIGGYFLLKVGNDELLAQWVNKFVNLIECFPDISVIHSWFLLRQDKPKVELARDSLLKAIRQGIPLCTEGMRLLFDGLLLFNQYNKKDEEIEKALTLIKDYATATDWSKPLTTFHGATPDSHFSSIYGIPEENTNGLVWLTLPTDNKWRLVQDILSQTVKERNLNSADLSDTNLIRANLIGTDLSSADLSSADLSSADLSRADLSRADLRGANLSGANLIGTDLSRANLSDTNLISADLSRADLSGANLRGANLSGANLRGANLSSADLSGTNLRGANLRGADLRGADLRGADLTSADLRDADLRGADLTSAILNETDFNNLEKGLTSTGKNHFSLNSINLLRDSLFVQRIVT